MPINLSKQDEYSSTISTMVIWNACYGSLAIVDIASTMLIFRSYSSIEMIHTHKTMLLGSAYVVGDMSSSTWFAIEAQSLASESQALVLKAYSCHYRETRAGFMNTYQKGDKKIR